MKHCYNPAARKRAVTLTLNEDLVARICESTNNLSSVVESLLAQYLAEDGRCRIAQARIIDSTVAMWNQFAERTGMFADEHSTL